MKIINCHVENFGKLHDKHYNFQSGLTILNEPNGSGKSTLAAFIKVMFFGFSGEGKRSIPENERKRFLPWQGGVYGGQLVFEYKGNTYQIVRTFGAKDKDDTFTLYDTKTNLESEDFSSHVGEELFLIDRDSFCRTVYIDSGDCEAGTTDRISAKLGNLAHNTDDMNNYETVKKKLSDMINAMSPTRKTGMIYKKKEKFAMLKEEARGEKTADEALKLLKQKRDAAKLLRDNLKNRQAEIQDNINSQIAVSDLASKKKSYDAILGKWQEAKDSYKEKRGYFKEREPDEKELTAMLDKGVELGGIIRHMEALRMNEERIAAGKRLEEKLSTMSGKASSEPKKSSKLPIVLCAAIVMIILGICLSNVWIAACSLIVVIPFLIVGSKGSGKADQKQEFSDDVDIEKIREELYAFRKDFAEYESLTKDKAAVCHTITEYIQGLGFDVEPDLSAQLFSIRDKERELAEAQRWYNRQDEEKNTFERENDISAFAGIMGEKQETLDDSYVELKAVTRSLEQAIEDISEYNGRIDNARNELALMAEAGDEARVLRDEIDRDIHRLEVITKTRDYLDRAKERFDAKYMNPVMEGFRKYYKCISGHEADAYSINAKMELSVMEHGNNRDIKLLSAGYRSLTGICMRMALVDAMYQEEKPFVVLDDVFVYLDEVKLKGAMEFLQILSKEYQIVYFTCNESRAQALTRI